MMSPEGSSATAILGFGCLFFMLGFGAGRLRFHALVRATVKGHSRLRARRVMRFADNPLFNIWTTHYTQSIELSKDLQKGYLTAGTVGLAVVATLLTRSTPQSILIYISAILFLISIVASLGSQSYFAIQHSQRAEKISIKIANKSGTSRPTLLPQSLRKHRHPWRLIVPLLAFGIAVSVLSFSVSGMIVCATNPSSIGEPWYFQCIQDKTPSKSK